MPACQKVGIFYEEGYTMELITRCLPVGTLPYDSIKHTTAMMAKLFQKTPFIALLPNLSSSDTLERHFFENLPGIVYGDDNKFILKTGTKEYNEEMSVLDAVYKNPDSKDIEKFSFEAEFSEKYFQMIKKFKSPNAIINMPGPFTVSQILTPVAEEQVLADKSYKKMFIQAVCVKALKIMKQINEISPNTVPIVILEEPELGQLSLIKRRNEVITNEFVVELISKVVEKLKGYGAIVGVQCLGKCDWSIPIKAGVNLISFDAYNNPNNLSIMADKLTKFLAKGGMINWGIVPVTSDNVIKGMKADYLYKRLITTMEGAVHSGIPSDLIYKSAIFSVNGNMDKLSVIFAEKAIMLTKQLISRFVADFGTV